MNEIKWNLVLLIYLFWIVIRSRNNDKGEIDAHVEVPYAPKNQYYICIVMKCVEGEGGDTLHYHLTKLDNLLVFNYIKYFISKKKRI